MFVYKNIKTGDFCLVSLKFEDSNWTFIREIDRCRINVSDIHCNAYFLENQPWIPLGNESGLVYELLVE
jgi:hypothetical protein